QRIQAACHVPVVTFLKVVQDGKILVQIPIEFAVLKISAHSSNTCLGGQVDFAVCVRIDIGADIPAFHDDVSKPDDFSLVIEQQIADAAHDGQLGCQVGNLGRP